MHASDFTQCYFGIFFDGYQLGTNPPKPYFDRKTGIQSPRQVLESQLTTSISEKQTEEDQLRTSITEKTREEGQLEASISEKQTAETQLIDDLADLRQEIADLEPNHARNVQRHQQEIADLQKQKTEIEEWLRASAQERIEQESALLADLWNARKRSMENQTQYFTCASEKSVLERNVADLQQQSDTCADDHLTLQEQYATCADEKSTLQEQVASFNTKYPCEKTKKTSPSPPKSDRILV